MASESIAPIRPSASGAIDSEPIRAPGIIVKYWLLFSGYPFRQRMSWHVFWCFVVNISVEHLSLIRFHSFRMKLIFDFLDMANWW